MASGSVLLLFLTYFPFIIYVQAIAVAEYMERGIIMSLTKAEHDILCDWIKNNLIPIKSFNDNSNSYVLKHIFEKTDIGFYVDNDDFKTAMTDCGFSVKNPDATNWVFNISKKSPALKR